MIILRDSLVLRHYNMEYNNAGGVICLKKDEPRKVSTTTVHNIS